MLVTIAPEAPETTVATLLATAATHGLDARATPDGRGGTIVGIEGALPVEAVSLPGISGVHAKHKPYMLASREHRAPSVIRVGDVEIGGALPILMAGPCVVEGRAEIIEAARAVKATGAMILRGGAFKPRTSPYAFQGLGEEGLRCLAAAREATGLPVVTEVMEPDQVDLVAEYADMLQVGSRNMANFPLLRRVGQANKPVLLKRGFSATIDEWMMSAEYVLAGGNPNVVLVERGIRSFDSSTRFSLDLNAVPLAKQLTHLPVIVDPSHGTGRRDLVPRMALAGLAAGADGLMIEAHPHPEQARCDGAQTVTTQELGRIWRRSLAIHAALAAMEDEPAEVAWQEVAVLA